MRTSRRLSTLVAGALLIGAATAHGAEVRLLASPALRPALGELVPAFERASGHTAVVLWGGTEAVTKRIRDGEVVDVVLIAAPNVDRLIAEGALAAAGRADVAKSGVGIALRTGLPRPDVSSGEAVKAAVLAARSVAYSAGPSGFYIAELFQRMGIADQIRDKVRITPSGVQVGEVIASGGADLGFQQVSELAHLPGIQYLGPLPPEIQHFTVFAAALHARAPAPDAAEALTRFLTSPEAAAAIRRSGMEPG